MEPTGMGIADYIEIIRTRWSTLMSVFLAVFFTAAVVVFVMKPVYKATAELYIDPGNASVLMMKSGGMFDPKVYLQTQVSVLKSEAIARQVVDGLKLDQNPSGSSAGNALLSGLLDFVRTADAKDPTLVMRKDAVKRFKKNLQTKVHRNSNVLEVSYLSGDPELSALVVNTAIDAMIRQNIELRMEPTREAMDWVSEKLEHLKGLTEQSEDSLRQLKKDKGLIVTGDNRANISLQGLADLNAKVLEAEAKRYAAEEKYRQVRMLSGDWDSIMSYPDVIGSRTIQDLKTLHANLSQQIAESSDKYGSRHPQMIRLNSEMDILEKKMKDEANLIIASIKNDYQESSRTEERLKSALERAKTEAMSYDIRSTEYENRRLELETARQTYDTILTKFQESSLANDASISSVQVLHRAEVPLDPYKPKRMVLLMLGFAAALSTSVGYVVVLDRIDSSFRSPRDIEEGLGLSLLGIVPKMKTLPQGGTEGALVPVSNPSSMYAETFRNIKGNILFRDLDKTPQVIQVSSAVGSEGKSTVALNLARMLAMAGEKVIIIDADMRRPMLAKMLGTQRDPGLSDVLDKRIPLEEVIRRIGVLDLSFIPAGSPSYNTDELAGSAKMDDVIHSLRQAYSRVIIDSPPCMAGVDAYMMATKSDGVVMVVRSGSANREPLARAIKELRRIKANIIGCVLNDPSDRSRPYYGQYYYTRD